jgi:hypothetical protein
MHQVLVEESGYGRCMAARRVVALALVFLFSGVCAAHARDAIEPRAGVFLRGQIQYPRAQGMSVMTANEDGSKLTVAMGFDGRCTGGGLGEIWAANVATKPVVRAQNGHFAATLTGASRKFGGVKGRVANFRWRLNGRFVDDDVIAATVTGSARVTLHGKVISRCKIASPANVRLAIRS